jgi:hypothetical protein
LADTGLVLTREDGAPLRSEGTASGRYFANPVTKERHEAHIVLPDGFIWTKGEVRFRVLLHAGRGMSFEDSNWIRYEFDWSKG